MSLYSCIISSPIGNIGIITQDNAIIAIDTLVAERPTNSANSELAQQLQAYFQNPKHQFALQTQPQGTPFQQRVWQALTNIPAGTTLTYGQLAKQLNSSPRAVGQACRRNPIPIVIPCHRVVGANAIGGYAGATEGEIANIKKWLLTHESESHHMQLKQTDKNFYQDQQNNNTF